MPLFAFQAIQDAAMAAAPTHALSVLEVILVAAAKTLIATAVLVLLLKLMAHWFPRLYAWLRASRERMPSLRIQKLDLLPAARVSDTTIAAARLLRALVSVLLLYFYLLLAFSFFPWTASLSGSLLTYVTAPLARMWGAFTGYLPNVVFLAIIVIVTRYALKVIRLVFDAIGRGTLTFTNFEPDWADPTYKIVRALVLAFALVVAFPYLPGANSDAFKGVSIFLGVLVSFGSSGAISNLVAGVVLTYTRAFNVGDRVAMGNTVGDVVARTLLVTRVRTIKNVDVTVPNALVLGGHISNYSAMAREGGVILHTSVTIGYATPWRTIHELLIGAAKATSGVLATPEPFVLQTALDDFYVKYEINAYTDLPAMMAQTCSRLHAAIQDAFAHAGVEIMSPHYRAVRDGDARALPDQAPGAAVGA